MPVEATTAARPAHEEIWSRFLRDIEVALDAQSFKTWFLPIVPQAYCEGELTVRVPNKFFYEWIEGHYCKLLASMLHKHVGAQGKLKYAIAPQRPQRAAALPQAKPSLGQVPGLREHIPPLNSLFTFEQMVEGDCNRLARSAAQGVVKQPGATAFNPLTIYTSNVVGLGKTHLGQAIVHGVRAQHPTKRAVFLPSNSFTSQFIEALRQGAVQVFMEYYKSVELLVLDDVQFLAGKQKTQEVFFNLFNHLHQLERQVVIISDRKPRELQGLQERLLSRFKWGLSVEMERPDYETRVALVWKKLERTSLRLAEELVGYIAASVETSIRDIEGVVTSLAARATLQGGQVQLPLIKQVIDDIVSQTSSELGLDYIQKTVAAHQGLSVAELTGKSRKRELVMARQLAIYFAKQYSSHSLKHIGKHFGGRDHSTVAYALRSVRALASTDKAFKATLLTLEKKLSRNITPRK